MRKLPLITIFILSLTLSLSEPFARGASENQVPKGDSTNGKVSKADEKFVKDAASGGLMEVELGKIAVEKASNQGVKDYGRRMQEDHGKANEELKTLAANKGIVLAKSMEAKQKRTVDRLSKLSGDKFDREYIKTMVDDHKEVLASFQREADKGTDAEIKQFASKYAPVIKTHLELAQKSDQQLKAK